MAGIGFELRKIYNEDSLFSKQKAYAYAGIVYTGPMLFGDFAYSWCRCSNNGSGNQ